MNTEYMLANFYDELCESDSACIRIDSAKMVSPDQLLLMMRGAQTEVVVEPIALAVEGSRVNHSSIISVRAQSRKSWHKLSNEELNRLQATCLVSQLERDNATQKLTLRLDMPLPEESSALDVSLSYVKAAVFEQRRWLDNFEGRKSASAPKKSGSQNYYRALYWSNPEAGVWRRIVHWLRKYSVEPTFFDSSRLVAPVPLQLSTLGLGSEMCIECTVDEVSSEMAICCSVTTTDSNATNAAQAEAEARRRNAAELARPNGICRLVHWTVVRDRLAAAVLLPPEISFLEEIEFAFEELVRVISNRDKPNQCSAEMRAIH